MIEIWYNLKSKIEYNLLRAGKDGGVGCEADSEGFKSAWLGTLADVGRDEGGARAFTATGGGIESSSIGRPAWAFLRSSCRVCKEKQASINFWWK